MLLYLVIIGIVSSDKTSDFKEVFEQRYALKQQNEEFEEILDSFPDAVLIAEDNKDDMEEGNRVVDESARRPLDAEHGPDEQMKLPPVKLVNNEF